MWPYFKFVTCTEYSQSDFSSKISSFFFFYLSSGRVGGVLVSSSVCLPTCRQSFSKRHTEQTVLFFRKIFHTRDNTTLFTPISL